MPEFLQRNPLILVLGGFAAALLVVIALEAGWGFGRTGAPAAPPGKAAVVDSKLLPPLADASPEQVYPETGTRPLFTPTRRPAPAAETVGTMVKGRFILQGVTILGDMRIAMLREKGGKIYRVEKGREADGVTVAEIEPERVTLRQGGDSEVVTLVVQKPGGAPAAPAAVPGTPAVSLTGPFGAPAPGSAPPGTAPGVPPSAPRPGAAPMPSSSGPPPVPAQGSPMTPQSPAGAAAPSPGTTSSTATATPAAAMTPEELLARRRARRAQQAQ